MSEAAWFLVQYVRAVGGPMWAAEAGGALRAEDGWRGPLTRPNKGDDPVHRFRVFAVPAEYAALPLDALIQAAGAGALERIFEDRALLRKWGLDQEAELPAKPRAPSPAGAPKGGAP